MLKLAWNYRNNAQKLALKSGGGGKWIGFDVLRVLNFLREVNKWMRYGKIYYTAKQQSILMLMLLLMASPPLKYTHKYTTNLACVYFFWIPNSIKYRIEVDYYYFFYTIFHTKDNGQKELIDRLQTFKIHYGFFFYLEYFD